jgi:hypothetical protein
MDYLPSVTVEPAHIPIDVPYLSGDGNRVDSFHAYSPNGVSRSRDDRAFTMDNAIVDMAAFLQTKSFFGLFGDTMGEEVEIKKERFKRVSPKGCLVLTATVLPALLKIWKARNLTVKEMTLDEKKLKERLDNTKDHIQHVASAHLRKLEYALQDMSRDPLTPVILSIQALLETLWDAQFASEIQCLYQDIGTCYPMWIENSFVRDLLMKAGWQHSEIETMPKDIRYRYYLSFFRQRPARALRRASSALRVSVRERYSTRHIQGSCHCESLSTMLPSKCEVRNSFHLVSVPSKSSGLELETHQIPLCVSENRVRFVAFSHVRSDGLGSSTSNSLPTCQVDFLQKLSNELLPEVEQPVPFYIDTLCVPLAGQAKRRALRNMRALFGLAEKVMVLDSDLRRTRSGLPQEDLTRMRISVWTKRLWTVQECAVSQAVYFLFKDRRLSLAELLDAYDTGDEFPLLRTQSMKDRRFNMASDSNLEHLFRALAVLSDDMQIAESLAHEANSPEGKAQIQTLREGYDKWKLRRILRIGHLALPQMRYFSEPHESAEFHTVITSVLTEYNLSILEPRGQGKDSEIDSTILFARLKNIQSIKLISDNEATLSPPSIIKYP